MARDRYFGGDADHGWQNLFCEISKGGGSVASDLKEQLRPGARAGGDIPGHSCLRNTHRHHDTADECGQRDPLNARSAIINVNFSSPPSVAVQRPQTARRSQ